MKLNPIRFCVATAVLTASAHAGEVHMRGLPKGPHPGQELQMKATAYSVQGKTKSGVHAQEGVAAADPSVLPLGTRIAVRGANGYLGEFVIADTGSAIRGREIDIYFASDAAAQRFGKQRVLVEVLDKGEGARDARKEMRNNPPEGPTAASKVAPPPRRP